MLVRSQFKRCLSISNTTLGPSGHGMKPQLSRLGTLYSHWRQWFMTKIHVLRLVSFDRRQFKRCLSVSNTTLGPSDHGMKPPSSMLGTLYSHWRQWFMTKIHILRQISFVRRQFKRCLSISNTTLGPSGHGMKPPTSMLGTLYSHWRQWFMTKIHILRQISFVRRQFKRCLSISNTTLGPSGHGMKQPSSRLGTLYSHWRQWFMTKIHVLRLVSFVQRQSKRWVLI